VLLAILLEASVFGLITDDSAIIVVVPRRELLKIILHLELALLQ
jgi:hypothetical protein